MARNANTATTKAKTTQPVVEEKAVTEEKVVAEEMVVETPAPKTKREVALTDRVPISNLNDWELNFVSVETDKDIVIPANANKWRKLTVAEIDGQVQSGNKYFVGIDGNGNNASIKIEDEDVFRYVFRLEDDEPVNVKVLDLDSVKALLKISNKDEYIAELNRLVVTNSDKKMISKLAQQANIEDVEGYKKTAIEKLTGYTF